MSGAEEVMDRAYRLLVEAAGQLTVDHPAAEPVGQAIDYLAGWLGRPTVIIGGYSPPSEKQQAPAPPGTCSDSLPLAGRGGLSGD